jgi:hypothetical protein
MNYDYELIQDKWLNAWPFTTDMRQQSERNKLRNKENNNHHNHIFKQIGMGKRLHAGSGIQTRGDALLDCPTCPTRGISYVL